MVDSNYQNRGELLLHHNFDGRELLREEALHALQNLYYLWQRPVWLRTVAGGARLLLSCSDRGPNATTTSETIRGDDRWPTT